MKRYVVRLEKEEREELETLVKAKKLAGYKRRHAQMLLMADANGPAWPDERIAEGLNVSRGQCEHLRKRFVEQGLDACFQRKQQENPSRLPSFDGEQEARLLALACSVPPKGYSQWSLRLLADQAVELAIVEKVSHETVRQTLKKTRSARI
jgi:hypothetical protein